jgi:hypothetical protein
MLPPKNNQWQLPSQSNTNKESKVFLAQAELGLVVTEDENLDLIKSLLT